MAQELILYFSTSQSQVALVVSDSIDLVNRGTIFFSQLGENAEKTGLLES